MWNRRRDEEVQPRPTPTSSPAAEPIAREIPSPPLPPSRNFDEPMVTRGSALLGKSVIVRGHIVSREDLHIDGEVEGTLEVKDNCVTVGKSGKVTTSGIVAKEVVVLGVVQGNVDATDRIEIRKEARLTGDLRTARIVIEDGAIFNGSVDIVRPEPKAQAPKPTAQPTGANATAAANPTSPVSAESPKQQTLTATLGSDKK
jgi:cytoskeletal protein CcmA (bactofilin family)